MTESEKKRELDCASDCMVREKETLETKRLILRQWRLADASDLYEYAKSEKVGLMAGRTPHESVDESENIIGNFLKNNETWAIEFKENHKVIGYVGLHRDSLRCLPEGESYELGYVLSETYWGQGIMPEACLAALNYAFGSASAQVVTVSHFTYNTQSRRVIEKLGFIYEGTLRHAFLRFDGAVLDIAVYSMLKSEFFKHDDRI